MGHGSHRPALPRGTVPAGRRTAPRRRAHRVAAAQPAGRMALGAGVPDGAGYGRDDGLERGRVTCWRRSRRPRARAPRRRIRRRRRRGRCRPRTGRARCSPAPGRPRQSSRRMRQQGRDRAVAGARCGVRCGAVDRRGPRAGVMAPSSSVSVLHGAQRVAAPRRVGRAGGQVLVLEDLPQLGAADLAALGVGVPLDDAGELDLQPARQVQAVLVLQQVGDAALAGLGVDPDDGLVAAAQVLRVDRQVRDLPGDSRRRPCPPRRRPSQGLQALLDGVLVRAGERGEDEVAAVGVPLGAPAAGCSTRPCGGSRRCRRSRSSGRCPGLNRFRPRVTRSTLPVRSPLPNRQPSMRSAPAR